MAMTRKEKTEWQKRKNRGEIAPTYGKVTVKAVNEWKKLMAEGLGQQKAANRVGVPCSSLRHYLR
jgi:hypothetical protein